MHLLLAAMLHLVYAYKIGAAMHASAAQGPVHGSFDGASQNSNSAMWAPTYDGHDKDGTIAIDVVQPLAPDGSGVFNVTATGVNGGKTFMCAAYGDTGDVTCNADGPLPPQVLLLLRVLGPHFYAVNKLDAKQHWQISSSSMSLKETADFTVTKTTATNVTIAMSRHGVQEHPALEATIDGTIVYDTVRDLPIDVHATLALNTRDAGMGTESPPATRIDVELQH